MHCQGNDVSGGACRHCQPLLFWVQPNSNAIFWLVPISPVVHPPAIVVYQLIIITVLTLVGSPTNLQPIFRTNPPCHLPQTADQLQLWPLEWYSRNQSLETESPRSKLLVTN